jgi:hypothetical protein
MDGHKISIGFDYLDQPPRLRIVHLIKGNLSKYENSVFNVGFCDSRDVPLILLFKQLENVRSRCTIEK